MDIIAPAGGGGGVTLHMTGYAPIKKTLQGCVGGGVLTPNFDNITTGEGELETLGYIRSQILILSPSLVVPMTSS